VRALTYEDTLSVLDRALVFGINPSLEGITQLCDALGRPQDAYAVMQITGTNGKTSTARLTHAILRAHGRTAGLYTSPQLQRMNERIEVTDGPVSDSQFAQAVSAALGAAEELRPGREGTAEGFTEFELTTAAALWLFREQAVDVAVLEVGLGGRWDATSVASPAVAVITGVGLDHTAILGDTRDEIAAEKAAIIREASAPVLGPGTVGVERVFLDRAEAMSTHARAVRAEGEVSPVPEDLTVRYRLLARPSAPDDSVIVDVDGVHADYERLSLRSPAYQAGNIATAIAAAESALGRGLETASIQAALDDVTLPGRFELVRSDPMTILDGSHNPQAAAVLAAAITDAWPFDAQRPLVVLGVLADKDARGIVAELATAVSEFVVTAPQSPRALGVDALASIVEAVSGLVPLRAASLEDALDFALEHAEFGVVVTGSLTTAGQARSRLLDASATSWTAPYGY